jgi:uncharacterized membrane protein HdeD (DUF308 family)
MAALKLRRWVAAFLGGFLIAAGVLVLLMLYSVIQISFALLSWLPLAAGAIVAILLWMREMRRRPIGPINGPHGFRPGQR